MIEIPAQAREILNQYHFDRIPFERMRSLIAATDPPEKLHLISTPMEPASMASVQSLPAVDSTEYQELKRQGEEAIAAGKLAVVILAGGMATRFGSKVKALAPLFPDRKERFIDVKLADAQRFANTNLDTTVMTSFATHEAITREVQGKNVHIAKQFASLRLTPKGELFKDKDGNVSLHATGHGDLPEALQVSGALSRMKAAGVKTVLMFNVDNLGATIDPVIFAKHMQLASPITVELARKRTGDKGGLPTQLQGKLVLSEAFRLPKDFPHDAFPLFNTNTLWMDLEVLDGQHDWTWCVVRKQVDGRDALQLERLVGELTWWYPTQYLEVSREASHSRFIPIKEADDLTKSRTEIEAVLRNRVGI